MNGRNVMIFWFRSAFLMQLTKWVSEWYTKENAALKAQTIYIKRQVSHPAAARWAI